MEKDHSNIKIKFDANGNVHREVAEEANLRQEKPRFLKKIVSVFGLGTI